MFGEFGIRSHSTTADKDPQGWAVHNSLWAGLTSFAAGGPMPWWHEHYIDPLHFRDTLNSHMGSAFSVQPLLTQSAWFRPHNRSEDVENLYLVGAGTHPGAGLPGVLSSSKIAEDLIVQDIH